MFKTYEEARAAWQADHAEMIVNGVWLPAVRSYLPDNFKHNPVAMDEAMAMDAPPPLFTDPNSAIPAILTTLIDPDVFRVLFAPNKAAGILGEQKKGTWIDDIALFPVIEATGEVSSYGDYNENGTAGINTGWPQRQNYIFQLIKEYGEREMERGSLARINYVSEIDKAAAQAINKFLNFSYLFGIQGLMNFGMVNDPGLGANLTPGPKTAGGTAWVVAGRVNGSANEIYLDIESMYLQLVVQTAGLVQQDTPLTLVISTTAAVALTATNSFNVNVSDLLKKNFPNLKVETVPQYNSAAQGNPQGVPAGNFAQLMASELEGQKTGTAAFSEKFRAHPVIRQTSSFRQKVSAGTWGSVLRMPAVVVGMIGL
jgi:hypothetical protein